MKAFLKFVVLFAVLVVVSSFSIPKSDAIVKKGNVIYSYGSGKVQCLSEVDSEGQIVILLKSLNENTQVKFERIDREGLEKLVLVAMMTVKEPSDICASCTFMQEVNTLINPKKVEKISLSGNIIYNAGNITVISPDSI